MGRPEFHRLVPVPDRRSPATDLGDLAGLDHGGVPLAVPLGGAERRTLLFFLASDCDGCRDFWERAAEPGWFGLGPDDALVVVTRDAEEEGGRPTTLRPGRGRLAGKTEDRRAVRALAPAGARVLCSSAAWKACGVSGPPFFVLVDGSTRSVLVEGVAWGAEQVAGHLAAALFDRARPDRHGD